MAINTVDDIRHIGAFRENVVAELTSVIQIKFPYSIPDRTTKTTLVSAGTVTQQDSKACISTGASASSSALLETRDTVVYQPGQGVTGRFTAVFTNGVAGSTQEIGIGDETDGYFIGFNGAAFGVLRRQNGTDYWTALPHVGDGSSEFIGQLDFTKGNVFQIQYQWLGYGQIAYSIYNPYSERYEILHRELYPNTSTLPSTYNPSFPFRIFAENTTNDTDIVLETSSIGVFIEGKATKLVNLFATSNSKTVTTEVSILDLRVRNTFQSKTTRGIIFPTNVFVAADGTKPVIINIYENATLGGTPSYSNINTNESIAEIDTAGTTVTGGYRLRSFVVNKVGTAGVDLDKLVRIHNLDHITVTAQSTNSSDVTVAVSWQELM